jgi:hypothetical protein
MLENYKQNWKELLGIFVILISMWGVYNRIIRYHDIMEAFSNKTKQKFEYTDIINLII